MWPIHVLTLFPQMFPGTLSHAIAAKARDKKLWDMKATNIRDFAGDKYLSVDDTPYGGGTGLVMLPEIVHKALTYAADNATGTPTFIYMSPRGKPLNQGDVRKIAANPDGVVILCGRYEGVDDRVIEHWRETRGLIEVSIGDYVLSGGEIAAQVLLDACIRVLPGVLIKEEATTSESFELDLLEFSQYTKPRIWQNKVVPEVLLSGDHQKIAAWRQKSAETITQERRPDLWEAYLLQEDQ